MLTKQYTSPLLDLTNDLIWVVDADLMLTYANQAYLNVMRQVTGKEKKLNESVLVEGFGEGYIEKWTSYFKRALSGERFELKEHFYNSSSNQIEYSQITFSPIIDEHKVVINVACQSRDITSFVKSNTEAEIILDASLDVICQIDEHGIFTNVSAACKELWGYEKHELIGKALIDFVVDEDKEKTIENIIEVRKGKTMTTFENRYKRKDGGIAFNQWSRRFDPITKNILGVARDAREKIKKEEVLIESENRFKALVQEGADMISIIDAAGKYMYTSPTTTAILGISPGEFYGNSVFDFIHPDDIERAAGYMQRISTESKVIVEPFRLRNGNNEWRWIETVLTNMLDNPAVGGIVANSRDITAKKAEEQRLKLLESVITNTKDSVLITEAEPFDEPGPKIIYVNKAFTQMTGYTAEEVIGKTPRILQGPKSDRAELARLSKALRNWESCEITVLNYKKNGEEFWVNFSVTPVADEKGWYTHWIAIERDVTEQKVRQRERELLTEITLNFNRENNYNIACERLCHTIGVFGEFDWVELWTINMERSKLKYNCHYLQDISHEVFYAETQGYQSFDKGSGLPGMVWQKKSEVFWNTLEDSKDFVRKEAAKKINLNTVLGIPLVNENEVIGVLLVGSKHGVEYLDKYAGLFANSQTFIGSEINRKKLENDLSHLYESIPDIVCIADLKGHFLKMNPAGCHLLGYSEEEILYHSLEEFVFAADKDITMQEIGKLGKGHSVASFENRYVQKSGGLCWLSWTANVNMQEGLIYATGRNITAEKKLLELNGTTSKMARIGSWEVDLIKNKILWTEMVHQLHETDPKNFEPDLAKVINFYREDFRPMVTGAVNQCMQLATPFDFEAVLVTANKNELWVRVLGNAEILHGECIRIYGSIQDINELKTTESQKNSLLATMEKSLNEIYIFDANTLQFSYANQGALLNTGYSKQEIEALTPVDLKPEFTTAKFYELIKPLVYKEKEKIIFFTNHKRKNGTLYPVEIHLQFVTEGNNKRFLAVILDITERKKAEGKLLSAFEEKNNILESIGDAFYALDVELNFTYMNSVCANLLAVKKENIIGKKLFTEFPELKNTLFEDELRKVQHTAKARKFEFHYAPFDAWFDESIYPTPTGISVYFADITQRKKANAEIAKSEEKRKLIMNGALDAIITIDTKEEITFWNAQAEVIFGWKAEDVIGKPLSEMIIPEHFRKYHVEGIKNYLKTGEGKALNVLLELSAIRRTREEFPIELTVIPIKQGGEEFFCAFIRDITQRKKTETARIMAEKNYHELFDKSNDAIYIHALDTGNLVDVNYRATELTGFDKKDFLEKDPSNLFADNPEYTMEKAMGYLQRAAQGEPQIFEWLAKKKDGTEGWFEMTLKRTSIAGVDKILAFQRDITERKKAEETILKANERFEKVTEATNDVIWDWDIESGTFFRSNAIDSFFGVGTSKFMDEKDFWKDNFHKDDVSSIKSSVQKALKDPDCYRWEEEYRIHNNNNEIFFVIDRGLIVRNKNGKAIRMVGAMTNITEQKKQEKRLIELNESLNAQATELKRSNEELEQFAFISSHDLQEPLRMISSFMDQLKRKYADRLDERGLQYIYFATDGAKRMKQIILDLLLYSRANKPTEQNERINLNEIVSDYTQLRRKVIAEKKATISFHGLPSMETYRAPITQIFHCLLDNALKYVDDNKSPNIEIDAIEKENVWQFAIKDNGIGIDPKFYDKIFIIFQRLQNRKEDDGTGIGLAIAKRSIEFLGGEIWVESEIDKGSTFNFTIAKTKQVI